VIKVYVNYFSDTRIISNAILTPIQVGRALTNHHLNMQGDDTGDNISLQNPAFCELTGMYWAWKNDLQSSHLGFMHYRRFLDFYSDIDRSNDTIHGVLVDSFGADFLGDFGLTENRFQEILSEYDGVVSKHIDLKKTGYKSVELQYRASPHHHIKDFRLAEKIVSELYPEDTIFFKKMAKGSILYPCNIFIFKRTLFTEYCEWLFPILNVLHERIDTAGYSPQAKRAVGYLAERLFTTFLLKKQEQQPELRFKELRLVVVQDTTLPPAGPKRPITDLPVTSVVASSDRAYLPHLASLIHSVFDNAHKESFLDFIVLDGGLSADDRKLLSNIPSTYDQNGRIVFIDMSRQFLSVNTHSYFTRSTFYRLMLPDLLDDYERILFLDTDMIVLTDLANIYNTDLQGKSIAAVLDLVMRTFTARGIPSIPEAGGKVAGLYLAEHLQMGNNYDNYFQAGIILFDLKNMRLKNYTTALKQDLSDNRYWFLDQDVLNKHLLGDVLFVNNKWNSLYLEADSLRYLKTDELKLYEQSINSPFVIHFAGRHKPWINDIHPLGHYYWYYLRKTYWYEATLKKYINKTASLFPSGALEDKKPSIRWRILRRGWSILPATVQQSILPFAMRLSRIIR
jgi:lipopolysaccharide biosynthesis glycosyltransferase